MTWDESRAREEFEKKNALLDALCEKLSPYDFYEEIFFDSEIPVPLRHIGESGKFGVEKLDLFDAVDKAQGIENVVLSPCTYGRSNYPKRMLLQNIYAFVVDLDYVSAYMLQSLLLSDWKDKNNLKMPIPTMIVNSGAGVHLYFHLVEPLSYPTDRDSIDSLNTKLTEKMSNLEGISPDRRPIGQGFRVVGSLNKFGEPITAYRVPDSSSWDIKYLSESINLAAPKMLTDKEFARRELALQAVNYKTKTVNFPQRWRMGRSWYDADLQRCKKDVSEGNRYTSFMALSVVAYKCGISKDELIKDLEELVDCYNKKSHTSIVKRSEITKAVRMYSPSAVMVKSTTLEEWYGFRYKHENRHKKDRLPRKKTQEMKDAGLITSIEKYGWEARDKKYPDGSWRKNSGRKTAEEKIKLWRAMNPDGNQSLCAKELSLHVKTVKKWWK